MVIAEVTKSGSESALSVIRKFSRRVQGVGLIQAARKRRYYERTTSKAVSKKRALKRIKRRADFRKLVKEGKAVEPTRRGSFRGHRPSTTTSTSTPARESTPAQIGGAPIAH